MAPQHILKKSISLVNVLIPPDVRAVILLGPAPFVEFSKNKTTYRHIHVSSSNMILMIDELARNWKSIYLQDLEFGASQEDVKSTGKRSSML